MTKTNKTCINCLHCIEVCDKGLLPNYLYHLSHDVEKNEIEKFNITSCNQCGKCDQVCPSGLPLRAAIESLIADDVADGVTDEDKKPQQKKTQQKETQQPNDQKNKVPVEANSAIVSLKNFETIVLFATLPLYIAAIGRYGLKVISLLFASIVAGLIIDKIAALLRSEKRTEWNWLSWLLIPLALPAGVPLWIPAVGTGFALTFGKHLFGGYGKNFINVIALAVVFVHLSYPAILVPSITKPFATPTYGFQAYASQVSISAQTLKTSFTEGAMSGKDILFGLIPGNIGDSYPLYIIFAGILFFLIGILDYRLPVSSIAGITIFSLVGHSWYPLQIVSPYYQLLVGPVLIVLIFFSMDVWSLPRTPISRWIGGFIFAFFVVLIRAFSGNAESVFFAVLLTNVFTPIIDWTIGIKTFTKKAKSEV